jgi:hypothetical protein
MKFLGSAVAAAALLAAAPALAAPGLGEKVYGTDVNKGVFELESRYGRLNGGPDDGEWKWVGEAAYGFSDRLYGAVLTEAEREPGADGQFEEVALEGVYRIGTLPGGVDFAVYGEYAANLKAEGDAVEFKALFEKQKGPFDGRLNLIAEHGLGDDDWTEYGYAASADWEVAHELRLGVAAFGDLGDDERWGGRREHFLGPVIKKDFDELPVGELEVEAGYLFAAGAAKDDADGQFRLLLEWEKKF